MMIDGVQLLHGSGANMLVIAEDKRGTTFPSAPADKDIFELTVYGVKPAGIYFYSVASADWEIYSPDGSAAPYDIGSQMIGKPEAGATVIQFTTVRAFSVLDGFKGCGAASLVNATANATFAISKIERNGSTTPLGTVVLATDGSSSFTQTVSGNMEFLVGETLTITAPDPQDTTLADISISIAGSLLF